MLRRAFSTAAHAAKTHQAIKTVPETICIHGKSYACDGMTNVSEKILEKIPRQLHRQHHHPLNTVKRKIEAQFSLLPSVTASNPVPFAVEDALSPVVTPQQNFDDLLVPSDHVSRSRNDTYYLNGDTLLRTHTSAHQSELLRKGLDAFLLTADVYRRDEIDASHYPVFHQMEGVRLFDLNDTGLKMMELESCDFDCEPLLSEIQDAHSDDQMFVQMVASHLKGSLERMVRELFCDDPNLKLRWVDAYFPFTHPSWELEIHYRDRWMEVLGCGIIQDAILKQSGRQDQIGWAFGIGLERIAMALYDIPDIRLFWSQDERFLTQFTAGELTKFKPFSKYPVTYKDISFWLPSAQEQSLHGIDAFHENDFNELVREISGDIIENVQLIDEFVNKKTGKQSKCYRMLYRAMDRTLTNEEINELQEVLRRRVQEDFKVTLR